MVDVGGNLEDEIEGHPFISIQENERSVRNGEMEKEGGDDMEGEMGTKDLVVQDLSVLLNTAEDMRNHFRAFERIKEIMQVLINANKILTELNEKADAVRAAIKQLETEKAVVEEELRLALVQVDQRRDEERAVRDRIAKAESRLEEIREMVQKTLGDRT
jgi:hypothetical protein